jgi:hypothetical protein
MEFEDYRKKEPFATPEGYFTKLNSNILKATCGSTPHHSRSIVIRTVTSMRWIGYAAMIAIIYAIAAGVTSIPGVDKRTTTSLGLQLANTNEYEDGIDSEYFDKMLESYPIDEYTFYSYLTDTGNN